jgi:uncharacterized membrane protein
VRVLALWQAHAILRLFDDGVHSLIIGLLRLLAGVQLFGFCTILRYLMFFCKTQTSLF